MTYNVRDDAFVYIVDLPDGVNEMVAPCIDGSYTVYLDCKLSDAGRLESYKHVMDHIRGHDHEEHDVQEIEARAHRKE